ncbi:MAG: putative oxidoreductase [Frankiales bacterium]|nr:putative oxidoreductase [Frankiales bacterium]
MSVTGDHVVEAGEMRRVLGHFATGVTVITGTDGDTPVGFVCQSFTSVSLEPPLVLFCPAHTSTSWPRIRTGGVFSVNVLAADQTELCKRFATSGGDKFADLAWTPTQWGPSLDGVLATVHCDVEQVHVAGDHDVVIGHVRKLVTHGDSGPLLFFKGQFGLSWD